MLFNITVQIVVKNRMNQYWIDVPFDAQSALNNQPGR